MSTENQTSAVISVLKRMRRGLEILLERESTAMHPELEVSWLEERQVLSCCSDEDDAIFTY